MRKPRGIKWLKLRCLSDFGNNWPSLDHTVPIICELDNQSSLLKPPPLWPLSKEMMQVFIVLSASVESIETIKCC